MTQRLIAMRHGQTDWNVAGRVQGQTDIPLNEVGREQAQAAAPFIASLRPTRIVSSDSMRARDTAAPVSELTGVPVEQHPDLREIYVGLWEGLTLEQAKAQFPIEWEEWHAGADVARGGGETRAQCAHRMAELVEQLLDEPQTGDALLIVSHGITLRNGIDLLALRGVVELEGPCPRFENTAHLVVNVVPSEQRSAAAAAAYGQINASANTDTEQAN